MSEVPDLAEAWIEAADGRRLTLRGSCRLGRKPDSDIVIDGEKASRKHALIHAQDGTDGSEYWLIDLGSLNGTFLNDQRVLRPTRLHNGDCMTIAGASFRFRQMAAGGETSGMTTVGGNATVMDLVERNVWLVVVDIVNSTQLSQTLAPNEFAINVGSWIEKGQRLIEMSGGRISKFLGDGFLACWDSRQDQTSKVIDALEGFHDLQDRSSVPFRTIVHYGKVAFGGRVQLGEESMIGPELMFIFRLEKLAAALGVSCCASTSAHARLKDDLDFEDVDGEHEFKGFPGLHRCYSIVWP
jgi:adenylate cyclase